MDFANGPLLRRVALRWQDVGTKLHVLQKYTLTGSSKERELSLVREFPSGPIGCVPAALS